MAAACETACGEPQPGVARARRAPRIAPCKVGPKTYGICLVSAAPRGAARAGAASSLAAVVARDSRGGVGPPKLSCFCRFALRPRSAKLLQNSAHGPPNVANFCKFAPTFAILPRAPGARRAATTPEQRTTRATRLRGGRGRPTSLPGTGMGHGGHHVPPDLSLTVTTLSARSRASWGAWAATTDPRYFCSFGRAGHCNCAPFCRFARGQLPGVLLQLLQICLRNDELLQVPPPSCRPFSSDGAAAPRPRRAPAAAAQRPSRRCRPGRAAASAATPGP